MYPSELDYKILDLPKSDDYSMVIITGKELRHKRFAYRLIEEFGDKVAAWYELDGTLTSNNSVNKNRFPEGTGRNIRSIQTSGRKIRLYFFIGKNSCQIIVKIRQTYCNVVSAHNFINLQYLFL